MAQMTKREHPGSGISVEDLQILCGICDEKSAILIWDDRYTGFRGRCQLCKYNWPES